MLSKLTGSFQREMEKLEVPRFDEKSQLWLQPFSEIINSMFPVEYVYGEWILWQETSEARCVNPESLVSKPVYQIETGSRVEGFCIPQFYVGKTEESFMSNPFDNGEHWQPDDDGMKTNDYVVENKTRELIPIFTVEHVADDPRYVHLRFTDEWKELKPRYKNATFVNHTYLIPINAYDGNKLGQLNKGRKPNEEFTYEMHGPVRKLQAKGFPSYEEDHTGVFKYPLGWPDEAKEWLARPRDNGWPSPDLLQDIFDSGCHLAPVGRGKRQDEPLEFLDYHKKPEQGSTSSRKTDKQSQEDLSIMDETEWRLSFSVAENKLGQSVSPLQRHVLVLLKMIKKAYFPDVISSYLLKNLLFWEIEKQDQSFWVEGNSAKCLLLMLDRLQTSLEEGHLPHYIIPQSNLLQYEDPAKLAEGASIICDVRTKILPKTISLLKRCHSMTYQSQTFLNNLQDLDPLATKAQDESLTDEGVIALSTSLIALFVRQAKKVVESMSRCISFGDDENIKKLMNIPLYAYQSLLARNLCKMWYLKHEKTKEEKSNEEEFTSFVKQEAPSLSDDGKFMTLTFNYFAQVKAGKDMLLLVPHTSAMERTREIHREEARKQFEWAQQPVMELFGWLQQSDLSNIKEKVSRELDGQLENLTMDDIEARVTKEFQNLFSERVLSSQKENSEDQ